MLSRCSRSFHPILFDSRRTDHGPTLFLCGGSDVISAVYQILGNFSSIVDNFNFCDFAHWFREKNFSCI